MERERRSTRFLNSGVPSEQDGATLREERISKGMEILFWQLVLSLIVAFIGSVAFLSRRFDDFPYAWF